MSFRQAEVRMACLCAQTVDLETKILLEIPVTIRSIDIEKLLKEMLAIPNCAAFRKEGFDFTLEPQSSQEHP